MRDPILVPMKSEPLAMLSRFPQARRYRRSSSRPNPSSYATGCSPGCCDCERPTSRGRHRARGRFLSSLTRPHRSFKLRWSSCKSSPHRPAEERRSRRLFEPRSEVSRAWRPRRRDPTRRKGCFARGTHLRVHKHLLGARCYGAVQVAADLWRLSSHPRRGGLRRGRERTGRTRPARHERCTGARSAPAPLRHCAPLRLPR